MYDLNNNQLTAVNGGLQTTAAVVTIIGVALQVTDAFEEFYQGFTDHRIEE